MTISRQVLFFLSYTLLTCYLSFTFLATKFKKHLVTTTLQTRKAFNRCQNREMNSNTNNSNEGIPNLIPFFSEVHSPSIGCTYCSVTAS